MTIRPCRFGSSLKTPTVTRLQSYSHPSPSNRSRDSPVGRRASSHSLDRGKPWWLHPRPSATTLARQATSTLINTQLGDVADPYSVTPVIHLSHSTTHLICSRARKQQQQLDSSVPLSLEYCHHYHSGQDGYDQPLRYVLTLDAQAADVFAEAALALAPFAATLARGCLIWLSLLAIEEMDISEVLIRPADGFTSMGDSFYSRHEFLCSLVQIFRSVTVASLIPEGSVSHLVCGLASHIP